MTLAYDIRVENWGNAIFAAFNGILTTYAIIAFIGVKNSIVDMVLGAYNWVIVPRAPKKRKRDDEPEPTLDWESTLYFGPDHDPASDERPRVSVSTTAMPRHGDTRARQRD